MSAVDQKEITSAYYNRAYYAKHLERLNKKDRFTRVKINRVASLLRPKTGERIIDLGCGVGTMTILLTPLGATMIGMDYSPDSLAIARECFRKEEPTRAFRGFCCDGRAIAMGNDTVEGVIAVDFTEHLDDALLVPTVQEVYRVLKKGGKFVVYTPCKTHLFERLKKHNIILKEDVSHIGLRTMKEYLIILKAARFSICESYFEPTHIPLFNILEKAIMPFPALGDFAKRRICIRAEK
jgi:SAM-dependent methyltransferase